MIGRKQHEDVPRPWDQTAAVDGSGILLTDPNLPDNPIIYANPGFEQLTGYTTGEVVGRNCRFLQGPDKDQPALEELRVALREGRDCQVVLRNYKKDGTPFWNELSVSPLRDKEGRVANFVGVQNDVTERKRAEEDRIRLSAIVDSSDDAIIGKTLDGIVNSWNRGAERLYGFSAEEAVGRSCSALILPDRPDEIAEKLEKVRQGEGIERRECVHITKHGKRIIVHLTVSPIRDFQGTVVGASTIARDITERKEAERRSATQHTLTRVLAESATLGDAAPRVLQTLCESMGWEFGELWNVDRPADVMKCTSTWHAPSTDLAEFDGVTRRLTFPWGIGLPGRVWESGEPAWVTDVIEKADFLRAPVAARAGLHGAFAFPILLGAEVLGVVCFYSQEVRQPDREALRMVATVGSQIGQFIEREQAQEAFRRSEERLRSVIANAPVVLFALDREGVFTLSEGKGLEALGLEPGQLVGLSTLELYEEQPRIVGDIRRALAGEEFSSIVEMAGLTFETWFSPVLDENGEVGGVIGVATDITERKKAEEERERLSRQSELILNSAGEGIVGLDREGRTRFANPAALAMLGYELEEIVGRYQHDLIHFSHPDGSAYPKEECPIYLALRDGEVHQVDDEVFWRKDGTSFPVEYTSTPIQENGEVTGTVVVFSDTTVRRRAEEEANLLRTVALEISEAEDLSSALRVVLRRVCEATNWAIGQAWVPSAAGTVLECNPAWYTTADNLAEFRTANEDLVFERGIGFPGHVWSTKRAAWSRDITASKFVRAQLADRFGLKAAMAIPVLADSEVVAVLDFFVFEEREEDERLVELVSGVAAQLGSVIQRKRAEENLKAYAARLDRSNRELQDFAYVASHDLQEPLRKVRTFGDRLKAKYAESLGGQGRDYLERMEGAAARMQDLIDDLLTLSRVTTQAQPFSPVDLDGVARHVVSDLETSIEQVRGRVEVSGLPTVEADRSQMRQLLQNLIGNALKFHREGEAPVVKVHGEVLHKRNDDQNGKPVDGRVCRILVEDNGIGFDEEHLERIFVPFQRLHGRNEYEGTGMGLAICRKVVLRHGGNITASSAPGMGASFVVTLPAKQPDGSGMRERSS